MILPYGLSDFTVEIWTMPSISRKSKLQILKEPLEGLSAVHAMGIMHRNVRPSNMLIMSIEPAQAMICDYGKAIEAENSVDTKIGPNYTLAPEIWTSNTDGPYTDKVDTWAYGLAIAEILGCSVRKHPGVPGDNNPRITRERYAAILGMLHDHGEKTPENRPLVDLTSKLLTWLPRDRWSPDQALEHEYWNPITEENLTDHRPGFEDTGKDPKTKRLRLAEA